MNLHLISIVGHDHSDIAPQYEFACLAGPGPAPCRLVTINDEVRPTDSCNAAEWWDELGPELVSEALPGRPPWLVDVRWFGEDQYPEIHPVKLEALVDEYLDDLDPDVIDDNWTDPKLGRDLSYNLIDHYGLPESNRGAVRDLIEVALRDGPLTAAGSPTPRHNSRPPARHRGGPEVGTEEVRILASRELLAGMLDRWSPPVRVKVERDDTEPTGWSMTLDTIDDGIQTSDDASARLALEQRLGSTIKALEQRLSSTVARIHEPWRRNDLLELSRQWKTNVVEFAAIGGGLAGIADGFALADGLRHNSDYAANDPQEPGDNPQSYPQTSRTTVESITESWNPGKSTWTGTFRQLAESIGAPVETVTPVDLDPDQTLVWTGQRVSDGEYGVDGGAALGWKLADPAHRVTNEYVPVHDYCRFWLANHSDICKADAVAIVWGKLFDPEDMGPRCIDHLPIDIHNCEQYAVFDLRGLWRLITRRGMV